MQQMTQLILLASSCAQMGYVVLQIPQLLLRVSKLGKCVARME